MSAAGRVCVVVVSFRSAQTIGDALRALPTHELAEVVVVDNASDDDTVARVRSLELPRLTVVASDTNLGFGPGCNLGVRRSDAASELVLFLNPDAVIDAASLDALVRYLEDHPSCGLVAPRMSRAGEPLTSAGRLATTRSELRYVLPPRLAGWLSERRFPPTYDATGPVPVVEGACMLVRRHAFEACGGFDEGQFLYFEEHHLARGLGRLGLTVDLDAEVVVDHLVGASTDTLGAGRETAYIAATVRYLRLHRGRLRARCYAWLAAASWRARLVFGDLSRERGLALLAGLRRARAEGSL